MSMSFDSVPAGILPGQRIMQGSRVPPSQLVPLPSPRAIVGGEDHPGIFFETVAFERVHDLADGPIDFFDDIAVKAPLGFAAEFVAHVQRDVRHVVGEVEKEWTILMRINEFDGMFGVPGGELVLIFMRDTGDNDFVVFEHAEVGIIAFPVFGINGWPHIVGVGEAEVFIEAMAQRQKLRRIAQVPFAENGSGVAALFDELGESHFVVADADF
jgi:hypothetical protein